MQQNIYDKTFSEKGNNYKPLNVFAKSFTNILPMQCVIVNEKNKRKFVFKHVFLVKAY